MVTPSKECYSNLKGLQPSVVLKYKLLMPDTCTHSVYKTALHDFHMIFL